MAGTKKKAKRPPKKPKKKSGKELEKKGKYEISEEERKRRSEVAKKRHEEGKLGGAQFGKLGGRPKKKRAAEVIAEKMAEDGEAMYKVLKDAMDEDNPHSIKMKAVEQLLKIEEKEARLQMDEDEHLAKMGKNELIDMLVQSFKGNPMVMEMFRMAADASPKNVGPQPEPGQLEDGVIDAEVVEDD